MSIIVKVGLFFLFLLIDSKSRILFGRLADRIGYIKIISLIWAGEMLFMMAFAYSAGQVLPRLVVGA